MHADCFRPSRVAMRAHPGCVSDAQLQSSHWCYICRGRSSAVAKIPVVVGSRNRVLSTTVMATAATQVGGCVGTETCVQAKAQHLRTFKEDLFCSTYISEENVASGSVWVVIRPRRGKLFPRCLCCTLDMGIYVHLSYSVAHQQPGIQLLLLSGLSWSWRGPATAAATFTRRTATLVISIQMQTAAFNLVPARTYWSTTAR
jgi:hypothetical protein